MTLAYRPPGVSVDELTSPNIAPLLSVPASVCIVGMSQGFVTRTDQLTMTGTTAQLLPNIPTDATLVSVTAVTDAVDPGDATNSDGTYTVTTDYTVQTVGHTVTRVGAGGMASGRIVYVTYKYLPVDYYTPFRLEDLGSVANRYGPAWADGAIFSDLTYAASIAFENGARFVIAQPLFARATHGNPATTATQPSSASSATAGSQANPLTWEDTLYGLRDIEDVNVVVPIIGQKTSTAVTDAAWLTAVQKVQDHMKWLKDNNQYCVAIAGEDATDSSSAYAPKATIRTHATTLAARYGGEMARQTVVVNAAKYTRPRPDAIATNLAVGGQWVAAAIAGMLASRPTSKPLTRKQLSGFAGVTDARSEQDKNDDAAVGLLVVHQRGLAVQVRHSITTDITAPQYSELSVVRCQHRMVETLRQTIDAQIVGEIIADSDAPFTVRSTVISVLDTLRAEKTIVNFANVQVRQLTLLPTTIEVRFSYKPAFPINYVNIAFSIDLTADGLTQITSSTQV